MPCTPDANAATPHLDHLNALDDLIHVAHTFISPLDDLPPQRSHLCSQHARHGQQQQHHTKSHEHGPADLEPKQDEHRDDVAWRAPQRMDCHCCVLELLCVVAHQGDHLAGALCLQSTGVTAAASGKLNGKHVACRVCKQAAHLASSQLTLPPPTHTHTQPHTPQLQARPTARPRPHILYTQRVMRIASHTLPVNNMPRPMPTQAPDMPGAFYDAPCPDCPHTRPNRHELPSACPRASCRGHPPAARCC